MFSLSVASKRGCYWIVDVRVLTESESALRSCLFLQLSLLTQYICTSRTLSRSVTINFTQYFTTWGFCRGRSCRLKVYIDIRGYELRHPMTDGGSCNEKRRSFSFHAFLGVSLHHRHPVAVILCHRRVLDCMGIQCFSCLLVGGQYLNRLRNTFLRRSVLDSSVAFALYVDIVECRDLCCSSEASPPPRVVYAADSSLAKLTALSQQADTTVTTAIVHNTQDGKVAETTAPSIAWNPNLSTLKRELAMATAAASPTAIVAGTCIVMFSYSEVIGCLLLSLYIS